MRYFPVLGFIFGSVLRQQGGHCQIEAISSDKKLSISSNAVKYSIIESPHPNRAVVASCTPHSEFSQAKMYIGRVA